MLGIDQTASTIPRTWPTTAAAFAVPLLSVVVAALTTPLLRDDPTAFLTWMPLAFFPWAQLVVVALVALSCLAAARSLARASARSIWMPALAIGLNLLTLLAWFLPITIQLTPDS
jgi:hypothetical protein